LAQLGLPRKKTFRAAAQARPDIQPQREDCLAPVKALAPAALVLLDETGSNLAMARDYARAPRGPRAYAIKPVNRGCPVTMLGALGRDGLVAAMTVDGFTDGAVFLAFLHAILLPQLRPGQGIMMDHLKAHKVAGSLRLVLTRQSPCFICLRMCLICRRLKSVGRRL
jgi:DDE superfamily endonuclease